MTENNNILIATIKSWNIEKAEKLVADNSQLNIKIISDKDELTYEKVIAFEPRYIFFPHWSWIIPEEIYNNFECVVFHMTDLPFGRGGSPLQNLIVCGLQETKISAIRVVNDIDAGPVYLKSDLSLEGTATEIFIRGSEVVFGKMIPKMLRKDIKPTPQEGEAILFKRRTPDQSDISDLGNISEIYDYIRMLDGEGYPNAFVETGRFKIEFSKACQENGQILAQALIKVKDGK
ncbi:MAG TPA: methionyl-tRNA formyltransferase [Phycisphaerales bacterium]|nr:methionyl-tRNA formyltransferase [Phycisphaerales bacterium]